MCFGLRGSFPKRYGPLNEKTLYVWVRDLHLILGLFASPFLLVFAASTLLLNHGWTTEVRAAGGGEGEESGRHVVIPADASRVDQAKAIMRQLGVSGEIRNIFRRKGRLEIPVMKPGLSLTIRVDLETSVATVERRESGFLDRLVYLHRSPGPHNAAIRGNWIFTRIWTWLIDGVVCTVIFASASGIYMWTVLKGERKVGLTLMGLGSMVFFTLILSIVF